MPKSGRRKKLETRYSTQMFIVGSVVLAVSVFYVVVIGGNWGAFLIGAIIGLLLARIYLREYIKAIIALKWIRPPSDLTEHELLISAIAEAEGRHRGAKGGLIGGILAAIAILILGENAMHSLAVGGGSFGAAILIYYALYARKLENRYWN